MKDFIEEKLALLKRNYLDEPENISRDFNIENKEIEGYNGRQLLEMLQNADDEANTEKDKVCLIELTNEQLIVANNGNTFSKDGLISLMKSDLSSKSQNQNKIGHKGTGFRSIINWAESIFIKSGDLVIEFSKENSENFLKILIEENPNIQNILKKYSTNTFPIAILPIPKWINDIPDNTKEFDTVILLKLKKDVVKDIQEQIVKLGEETLIFLNNLEKIILKSELRSEILSKKKINTSQILLQILNENKEIIKEKIFNINLKKGKLRFLDIEKSFEIKIAYTDDLEYSTTNKLYSYFVTNDSLPLPLLVHATFELESNRKHILNSPINKFLLESVAELLVNSSIDICKKDKNVSWKALSLLAFNGELGEVLKELDFKNILLEEIKKAKLIPSINNTYLSCNDNPIYYQEYNLNFLPPEIFHNFVLFTEDKKLNKLINEIIKKNEDFDFLFEKLNMISSRLDVHNRAKLIKFVLEKHNTALEKLFNTNRKKLPSLFIDTDNNVIKIWESESYLADNTTKDIKIPKYVDIKIINIQLYEELKKIFNVRNKEDFFQANKNEYFIYFNIKNYDIENILEKLIINLNKENILEFVAFLWDLYNKNNKYKYETFNKIKLLDRNYNLININQLFLGSDYDNDNTEKLLQKVDGFKFLASIDNLFPISEKVDLYEKARFFEWLGVKKLPSENFIYYESQNDIKKNPLKIFNPYNNITNYDTYVFRNLKYPLIIGDKKVESEKEIESEKIIYNVLSIEKFDAILENADFEDIIIWILKDDRLDKALKLGYEHNSSSLFGITFKKDRSPRCLDSQKISSYIVYKLKKTKWIKSSSGKVSPEICCFSKIDLDISPVIEKPIIDFENEKFKQNNIKRENIIALLKKIGVCDNLGEFSQDTIYEILETLPTKDPTGKKANKIYEEIIRSKNLSDLDKENSKYKSFIQDGKILSNKNGVKKYLHISEVYYIENTSFCNDIINYFNILEIPRRLGKSKVKSILGVNILEGLHFKLNTQPISHHINKIFQEDFLNFKPYIYVYRMDKEKNEYEFEKINKLKIELCTQIDASFELLDRLQPFNIQDFEYLFISEKNTFFIKIPDIGYNNIEDLKKDIDFCDIFSEIISEVLKVDELRITYRELYPYNENQRNKILKRDLDDQKLEKISKSKESFLQFTKLSEEIIENKLADFIENPKDNNTKKTSILKNDSQNINKEVKTSIDKTHLSQDWNAEYNVDEVIPEINNYSFEPLIKRPTSIREHNKINHIKPEVEEALDTKLSNEDKKNIGYYGENLVFKHFYDSLKNEYPEAKFSYNIANDGFFAEINGKKILELIWHNKNFDCGIGHDMKLIKNKEEFLIEIKTTKMDDKEWFEISNKQWETAKEIGDKYFIYRVINVGNENPRIIIIKNPYQLWKDEKLEVHSLKIRI